jgi:hypothetical protein
MVVLMVVQMVAVAVVAVMTSVITFDKENLIAVGVVAVAVAVAVFDVGASQLMQKAEAMTKGMKLEFERRQSKAAKSPDL